jgi:hypothetical protein
MTFRVRPEPALLLIAAALSVPAAPVRALQDPPPAARVVGEQFTIVLPDGWSVYDQMEALSRKPSTVGLLLFSAQPVTKDGAAAADGALLAKADSGEMPSFFVDRVRAEKGMSCDKLPGGAIYQVGLKLKQDPAVSTLSSKITHATAPDHKEIELGGCRGVRFLIEARKNDAAKHRILDVRVVSDGKLLYLFTLRNRGDHYARNIEAFENAIASVRFKAAK